MHILSAHHRTAVLASIAVVDAVRPQDLAAVTPCAGWNLLDLLAHMTVQHRGFAAAARGNGADPDKWRAETVVDAVRFDPTRTYAEAAHDVLDAFAGYDPSGTDAPFALPEFGVGAVFPGEVAMGFHFVDYVVHGWDVAESLNRRFDLPAEVIAAVRPLAMAVPDGDLRAVANAPFAPAVKDSGTTDFECILGHLGRRPDWRQARDSGTQDAFVGG